tara:strand:+ start:42 stop:284 length:243 start_codon:yes stop_codon:yes gene_type:complete
MANSERYNIDLVSVATVNVTNPQKPGAGMGMEQKGSGFKGEKGGKHDKAAKHGDTGKTKSAKTKPGSGYTPPPSKGKKKP